MNVHCPHKKNSPQLSVADPGYPRSYISFKVGDANLLIDQFFLRIWKWKKLDREGATCIPLDRNDYNVDCQNKTLGNCFLKSVKPKNWVTLNGLLLYLVVSADCWCSSGSGSGSRRREGGRRTSRCYVLITLFFYTVSPVATANLTLSFKI